ncbi:MAG: SusD/RagB family nutrient-binding outer rane lipoprotein [Ignavibacteria bacterium]|nr:SusD/RagB family nutrient-binding outer rane lipoprotein [Ignavibacteria bacterium]
MKTKRTASLAIITLIILSSCSNWIDPAINIDPTNPKDASFNVILPTIEANLAFQSGGDIGRLTSLFTQHHLGTGRQHQGYYEYNLTEADLDNLWLNMYVGPMMDLSIMIKKAKDAPYYQGIAEILMAYSLGTLSDLLGDIPYSQAFQGSDNLKPVYDKQQVLYTSIIGLLSNGITHLGAATSSSKPTSDDFIYGGNKANWIKAANALKARYYLHIKNLPQAKASVSGAFMSNADDMQFVFGEEYLNSNPLYQFMQERGDISLGPKLVELLKNSTDPRIVSFTDDTAYSTEALPGTFFADAKSPVFFITYAEIKFIEAECNLSAGDKAGAYAAYKEGIKASLEKFGVASANIGTYLANPKVDVGEANLTLENIINQKYVALYTQSETWTDWRRTGFPTLTPTVSGGQVPRRFIYPQNERLYNGDNLKSVGDNPSGTSFAYTKMYWDKLWNP